MDTVLRGIVIGLSLAAPVGPINVEIVRRGLRSGFLSGWLVGVGAITGDIMYCLLVIVGLSTIIDHLAVQAVLLAAGAGLLGILGISGLRSAIRHSRLLSIEPAPASTTSYRTGLLMALVNPMGVVFWTSVGGGLVASVVETAVISEVIGLVLGVILGLGLWITALSMFVQGGRAFVTERAFRVINAVSSVILLVFAISFALQALDRVVAL